MSDIAVDDLRRPLRVPGSRPLRSLKEERYCQSRALGLGLRAAARDAGLDDYTGVQSKYEAKKRVRDRIAYFRSQDVTPEYHIAKRRAIEQRLDKAAFGDLFAECIDIVDGRPVVNWEKLKASELSIAIQEFRVDKDTGAIVNIGRENALQAIQQLRDMRGYKTAEHVKLSVNAETLSDEELLRIAQSVPALPAPEETKIIDDENDVVSD